MRTATAAVIRPGGKRRRPKPVTATTVGLDDRIVIGYLNLLLGNEGIGKGTVLAWMIARWTRGELPGAFYGESINVGILGDEDSFDDVWTPRLHAAGAVLGCVFQIERPDGEYVEVGKDKVKLGKKCQELDIKMLIYDQLLDNLDGDVNERRQERSDRRCDRSAASRWRSGSERSEHCTPTEGRELPRARVRLGGFQRGRQVKSPAGRAS